MILTFQIERILLLRGAFPGQLILKVWKTKMKQAQNNIKRIENIYCLTWHELCNTA